MRYALRVLGKFELLSPEGYEVPVPSQRLQTLVAALAAADGKAVPRSQLWDLLWEGRAEEQARNSLRQAFTALRKVFAGSGSFPFRITRQDAAIEPAEISSDLQQLAALTSDPAAEMSAPPRYGEFLEGVHLPGTEAQRWLVSQRQHGHTLYAELMAKRMDTLEQLGRLSQASDCAGALLEMDPASETAHRLLMRVYLADGDRVRALKQFHACQNTLREEFGIEPDAQTQALHDTIRAVAPADATQHVPELSVISIPTTAPSIVVLPFENLASADEQDRFCDSLTDSLTTELSRFHDLHVIASHSAFAYKGKQLGIPEICQQLGVRFALSGSVQRSSNRIRVQAQLVDGADGRLLWIERYDREADDILALQDDLSETIVGTLATSYGGRLRKAWLSDRRRRNPSDLEAFDYFTRAVAAMDLWTPEGVAEGRQLLLKAVGLDPDFAKAWAKLAWTYLVDASEGWSKDIVASINAGVDAAKTAVARDASEPWAVWVMAASHIYAGRHDLGIAEFERAVKLNPNDADILMDYGYYLSFAGRTEEGLAAAAKAMRLNPHHPEWYLLELLQLQFDAREYGDVIKTADKLTAAESPISFLLLGASHAAMGAFPEARIAIDRAVQLDPDATLKKWSDPRLLPYKNPEDLAHLRTNLIKAGLGE